MALKISSSLILPRVSCQIGSGNSSSPELAGLLQIVGKDVEQELGIRISVDMSVSFGVEELAKGRCVDDIAVLGRVSSNPRCKHQLTWANVIPYGELT